MPREKAPSLHDYDPARDRPHNERAQLERMFPRDREIEDRMTNAESVIFDVVKEQVRVAPQVAAATEMVETAEKTQNAAMAYADRIHSLMLGIEQRQTLADTRQSAADSRQRMSYFAIAIAAVVLIVGLLLKVEADKLAMLLGSFGALVALFLGGINRQAAKESGSLRPPPK